MDAVTIAKIKGNFEIARKSISTYVVAAVTAAGGWWLAKTTAEQLAWLTDHPQLAPLIPYAPAISGVVWVVFRLWPQFFPRPPEVKDARAVQFDEWVKRAQEMGFIVPGATTAPTPAPVNPAPPASMVDPLFTVLAAALPHLGDDTIASVVGQLRAARPTARATDVPLP